MSKQQSRRKLLRGKLFAQSGQNSRYLSLKLNFSVVQKRDAAFPVLRTRYGSGIKIMPYRDTNTTPVPPQLFIAQSGRSAWKWLVMTFILGWFYGIVTVAVLSMTISHAHAESIGPLAQPWLLITSSSQLYSYPTQELCDGALMREGSIKGACANLCSADWSPANGFKSLAALRCALK
jgi:hypothetical protein